MRNCVFSCVGGRMPIPFPTWSKTNPGEAGQTDWDEMMTIAQFFRRKKRVRLPKTDEQREREHTRWAETYYAIPKEERKQMRREARKRWRDSLTPEQKEEQRLKDKARRERWWAGLSEEDRAKWRARFAGYRQKKRDEIQARRNNLR